MTRIVAVTGAGGFIGRHAVAALSADATNTVVALTRADGPEHAEHWLRRADFIVHCAGVNRPVHAEEFESGNVGLTRQVVEAAIAGGRKPTVILASSYQAGADSPYGRSKAAAEAVVSAAARQGSIRAVVLRLPGVFGKWSRPGYNSVVATFCHNLARGMPIVVNDRAAPIRLLHIDQVTAMIAGMMDRPGGQDLVMIDEFPGSHALTVGQLADIMHGFAMSRETGTLPDVGDPFIRQLWSTWVSFLPADRLAYRLAPRVDARGVLAEIFRSPGAGQLFMSRTLPGITRGEHWHHTKTEKFIVVEGDAVIRFRPVDGTDVVEYAVRGEDLTVVDIPPGWAHHIQNVGPGTLVVLFWASEPFDADRPDTMPAEVHRAAT